MASRIMEHVLHPRNAGPIEAPDAEGYADLDGAAPRVTLQIRCDAGKITAIGFLAFGCGHLIACCSVATTLCEGRAPSDCLKLSSQDILAVLVDMPEQRKFCAEIVMRAVFDAARKYQHTFPQTPPNS